MNKDIKMVVYVTEDEKKQIKELAEKHRFGNVSRYVVETILNTKKENKNK
jgi:hypothetical protein